MTPKKIELLPDGNLKITINYVLCLRGRQKQIIVPGEESLEGDTMRDTTIDQKEHQAVRRKRRAAFFKLSHGVFFDAMSSYRNTGTKAWLWSIQ